MDVATELALFSCLNKEKTTMRRIIAVAPPGAYAFS
jgi:hypothetical protein